MVTRFNIVRNGGCDWYFTFEDIHYNMSFWLNFFEIYLKAIFLIGFVYLFCVVLRV